MGAIESFEQAVQFARQNIAENGFTVTDEDLERPWGGFYRLDNADAEKFIGMYFPEMEFETYEGLSPKFLFIKPGQRLSWQYHNRRAEIWRAVKGPVGVKLSEDDTEPEQTRTLQEGEAVTFDATVHHRLIGLDGVYGVVAEIWQHTDPDNLSDEQDIVRVQDDYGR